MKLNCDQCGYFREIHQNKKTKKFICRQCNHNDPTKYKICTACKKLKPVEAYFGKKPFCRKCWRNHPCKLKKCCRCKKKKPGHVVIQTNQPVCQNCNSQDVSKHRRCFCCGRMAKVYTRDINYNPLCRRKKCREKTSSPEAS